MSEAGAAGAYVPVELTLFSRRDCPLCDEMRRDLAAWDAGQGRYHLTVVDIETDRRLSRRYGLRIPVLTRGEEEICAGRLDTTRHGLFLAAVNLSQSSMAGCGPWITAR